MNMDPASVWRAKPRRKRRPRRQKSKLFLEIKIVEIDYLTKDEVQNIENNVLNTQIVYPQDETILDVFKRQVKSTPNNIAVV